jgi:hypothetical protein
MTSSLSISRGGMAWRSQPSVSLACLPAREAEHGCLKHRRGVLLATRRSPRVCLHPDCPHCDVRRVAVCALAGPEILPRLAALATERRLAPEKILFEDGEPAEASYDVTQGILKLSKLLADRTS